MAPLKNYGTRYTKEELDLVRKLYKKGLTLVEISKQIGRTHCSVKRVCVKNRIVGRCPKVNCKNKIITYLNKGMLDIEIAKLVGVHSETVGRLRRKLGMPRDVDNYKKRHRLLCVKGIKRYKALVKNGEVPKPGESVRLNNSKNGWPPVTMGELTILQVLEKYPGLTCREISKQLEYKTSNWLNTLLADLNKRGWLDRVGTYNSKWSLSDDTKNMRLQHKEVD